MGLHLYVHRSALGDCTNGGVSAKHDTLCVVNIDGPFEPDGNSPPVLLENHVQGCLRIVPAYRHSTGRWLRAPGHFMMGGNYAATSDSRFSQKCESFLGHRFYGAVAIHDRQE